MLKAFNSFQFVSCFALAPFGISWLSQATFPGADFAVYVACVIYFVMFIINFFAVLSSVDRL